MIIIAVKQLISKKQLKEHIKNGNIRKQYNSGKGFLDAFESRIEKAAVLVLFKTNRFLT